MFDLYIVDKFCTIAFDTCVSYTSGEPRNQRGGNNLTSGNRDSVYILGKRKPGTTLPPVDRARIEAAKRATEKLLKGEDKTK